MMSLERKWRMHQHGRKRGFVLGGTTVVSDEQFPEYVSIWADQGDKAPSCGGFILDRYHIMTAANCGKFTKWAVAGTRWRLNTDKKPFNRLTSCSNAPGATSTSMGIWYKDYRICKLEMPLTFSKSLWCDRLGCCVEDDIRNSAIITTQSTILFLNVIILIVMNSLLSCTHVVHYLIHKTDQSAIRDNKTR